MRQLFLLSRIHFCLSGSDGQRTTRRKPPARNRRRQDQKATYLPRRRATPRETLWETQKQNVFTRPGEAIPRRIPTIGTQAAGKYDTLFRKRESNVCIFFASHSLAPVMYNRVLFSRISFAEANANIWQTIFFSDDLFRRTFLQMYKHSLLDYIWIFKF